MLISKINMIWETYTKQKCFKHYFLLENNGYKDESPLKRDYKRWWRKREKHRNCFEYSCLESSFYVVHACEPWKIINDSFRTVSRRIAGRRRGKNWITLERILGPPDTQTEIALEPFHDG